MRKTGCTIGVREAAGRGLALPKQGHPTMQHTTLSYAWTSAEAALPLGWRLRGVELLNHFTKLGGPLPADVWHAWASERRHGEGSEVYGAGSTPVQALNDLAQKLRGSIVEQR